VIRHDGGVELIVGVRWMLEPSPCLAPRSGGRSPSRVAWRGRPS
jgi:hypothetical protein